MRGAVVVASISVLAACLAASTFALSQPAYVKAAGKICAQRAKKLHRLRRFSLDKASPAKIARRLRAVIRIYGRGLVRLRALKPPRAFSYLVPRWLGFERTRLALWKRARRAALAGKGAAARYYVNRANVAGARAAEISNGLEIKRCE